MKFIGIVLSIMVALAYSNYALAAEGHSHDEHKGLMAEQQDSKDESDSVSVNNKICPVSGEDVEAMGGGIEYEYDGKIYNLCCAGCVDLFEKDPEKYIKITEEEVANREEKGSHHAH